MSTPTSPVSDPVPRAGMEERDCAHSIPSPTSLDTAAASELPEMQATSAIPSPHFALPPLPRPSDPEGNVGPDPEAGGALRPSTGTAWSTEPTVLSSGSGATPSPQLSDEPCGTHTPLRNELGAGGSDPEPSAGWPTAPSPQHDQLAWYLGEQYLELDRREQLLQTQLAQFDNERRQFRLLAGQRELELAEREAAVERERVELDQRQQQVSATEASQHDLQLVLLRERRDLQEEREQFAGDQAAIRGALATEVQATHARLDRERDEAAADCARIREELQRDQQLSESRLRFREEHLQRTMREFEQQQHEFRVEQQQGRTRLAETASQLLLRRQQLEGMRVALEAHEGSLARDRQWLQVERRGLAARVQQDRDRLRAEQEEWHASRSEQQADLQRQREQLRLHAAALETRRQQLEELRREMEQTHAETLELRLAVEEAYAQLTRTVGEETTRERVEQARLLLAEHYRNSRDTLAIQRQELEQLQARLASERNDLLFERQALAEWVTAQEQLVARRTAELDHDHAALQNRELAWRQAEDRWHSERQQAETIIRDLLRQRDERPGTSPSDG